MSLLRWIKRLLWTAILGAGMFGPILAQKRRTVSRGRWLILMYHRVAEKERDFKTLCVSPAHFDAHLRFLKAHFPVVSLDQVAEQIGAGHAPGTDSVVITFDDGYQDNRLNAFAVLKKYGLPATVFLASGHITSGRALWWDRVACLAGAGRNSGRDLRWTPELYPEDLREPVRELLGGPVTERDRRIEEVASFLKRVPEPQKNAILEDLERQCPELPDRTCPPILTWDEVREMAEGGVTFGSHTVTHAILTRVTPEQAHHEVLASKQDIEAQLDRPVRHFAYPNGMPGDHSPDLARLLKECGYQSACLAYGGCNSAGADPFALKRMYVGDLSVPELAAGLLKAFGTPDRPGNGTKARPREDAR